jgi:hypothetical protein
MKQQIDEALCGEDFDIADTVETGRARQSKKRMTSGPQYRVREVTRGKHLDRMVFGDGTVGDKVANKIIYDALRMLPHSKRRGREAVHSGCFEPAEDALYIDKYTGWLSGFRGYQPGDYRPTFPPLPRPATALSATSSAAQVRPDRRTGRKAPQAAAPRNTFFNDLSE